MSDLVSALSGSLGLAGSMNAGEWIGERKKVEGAMKGGGRGTVIAHRLQGVASPLLVYPAALARPTPEAFEELFTRNRWPAAWRNGVFAFHHYHSNSHEVLGIYEGEVTVQLGGEGGVPLTARAGDVVVLAAGTAHRKLASRGALGVVGAYPEGSDPDTCRGVPDAALRVALPACDPVFGAGGPLFAHWK